MTTAAIAADFADIAAEQDLIDAILAEHAKVEASQESVRESIATARKSRGRRLNTL